LEIVLSNKKIKKIMFSIKKQLSFTVTR